MIPLPREAVEVCVKEMSRYAAAYENHLLTNGDLGLDMFLEFAAQVEQIKTTIATLNASL